MANVVNLILSSLPFEFVRRDTYTGRSLTVERDQQRARLVQRGTR